MEAIKMKETKTQRLLRYMSQMTKNGILPPEKASSLVKQYQRDKNLGDIIDQLVMLSVEEARTKIYENILNAMLEDENLK